MQCSASGVELRELPHNTFVSRIVKGFMSQCAETTIKIVCCECHALGALRQEGLPEVEAEWFPGTAQERKSLAWRDTQNGPKPSFEAPGTD